MHGCSASDQLLDEPPPIGVSSLPRSALLDSLPAGPSYDLAALRARLRSHESASPEGGGGELHVLAIGASVTFLFADMCSEDTAHVCSTGPEEDAAALDERMYQLRMAKGKRTGAEGSDWLVQVHVAGACACGAPVALPRALGRACPFANALAFSRAPCVHLCYCRA